MSRLNEAISNVAYILDVLRAYKNIVEAGDCNNCGRKNTCQYCPSPGQLVRYNCPFYQMAKFIGAEDDPEIQMEIKAYTDIAEGVKGMPTIEPERKTGKWVNNLHDIPICNQCGYMTPYDRAIDDYEYGNYCPNCGAKMEGLESWES